MDIKSLEQEIEEKENAYNFAKQKYKEALDNYSMYLEARKTPERSTITSKKLIDEAIENFGTFVN